MSGHSSEAQGLSERERNSLDDALVDSGCHGFQGDHPDLYAAAERILAERTAQARAEIERLTLRCEDLNDEIANCTVLDWQERAERAEAKVARVEAYLADAERGMGAWGTCSHEWLSLDRLRAALEDQP